MTVPSSSRGLTPQTDPRTPRTPSGPRGWRALLGRWRRPAPLAPERAGTPLAPQLAARLLLSQRQAPTLSDFSAQLLLACWDAAAREGSPAEALQVHFERRGGQWQLRDPGALGLKLRGAQVHLRDPMAVRAPWHDSAAQRSAARALQAFGAQGAGALEDHPALAHFGGARTRDLDVDASVFPCLLAKGPAQG